MNKTEKLSIGGYLFTLDAEAAQEAGRYIQDMEAFYSNQEITDGIEERMAELLRERVKEGGVVSKEMILGIIDILGRPERIAQDEPDSVKPDNSGKTVKKLYRDMENSKLAGVCGGLAAYFNTDPVIFRVAFAVLAIVGLVLGDNPLLDWIGAFTIPAIYCILWICMPPARTARQRWEMRGDDGTAEGVRRSVESAAGNVGNALRQVGNSPAWSTVGRVFEIIIGIFLLLVSVSGLFAEGLALFGWQWIGFSEVSRDFLTEFTENYPKAVGVLATPWVQTLMVAVCSLPFIGMLYGSIMLLFRIKSPRWRPGLVVFVLWLMCLVALAILICSCIISATAV